MTSDQQTDAPHISRIQGVAHAHGRPLPPGEWHNEPDRVEFSHAGHPCLLVRGSLGAWCGYVAVPSSHPWHGREYDEVEVDVHGGLTHADRCSGRICHVPQPGESDDVWWFGFDCAHGFDLVPSMTMYGLECGEYRTTDYVAAETRRLAEQFAAVGGAP